MRAIFKQFFRTLKVGTEQYVIQHCNNINFGIILSININVGIVLCININVGIKVPLKSSQISF